MSYAKGEASDRGLGSGLRWWWRTCESGSIGKGVWQDDETIKIGVDHTENNDPDARCPYLHEVDGTSAILI